MIVSNLDVFANGADTLPDHYVHARVTPARTLSIPPGARTAPAGTAHQEDHMTDDEKVARVRAAEMTAAIGSAFFDTQQPEGPPSFAVGATVLYPAFDDAILDAVDRLFATDIEQAARRNPTGLIGLLDSSREFLFTLVTLSCGEQMERSGVDGAAIARTLNDLSARPYVLGAVLRALALAMPRAVEFGKLAAATRALLWVRERLAIEGPDGPVADAMRAEIEKQKGA